MQKRYSEEQIVKILGEVRGGKSIAETGRQYGVSEQTIYRWKNKFGDMEVSDVKRMRGLEQENRRLKEIVAELELDKRALKDLLSKNW